MGVNLTPVFRPDVDDVMPDGDVHLLLTELDELDRLAEAEGLTPLSAFMDPEDVGEDLEVEEPEEEDLGDMSDDSVAWAPIDEGLKALTALAEAVKASSQWGDNEKEILSEELEDLANCLKEASSRAYHFYLVAVE